MNNFSGLLEGLDVAVEDHLCDDAVYYPLSPDAADGLPVRVMIDYPRSADRMTGMSFTRSRPLMRVARLRLPDLKEGHYFRHGADIWQVAEAPTAEDDGRWWVFEVQPG